MTSHSPSNRPPDLDSRFERVRLALEGLSLGDAYGEQFFREPTRLHLLDDSPYLPPGEWNYTDDTEMALGIAEVLSTHGTVEQDHLARTFARRFLLAPSRGYGPGAIRLLTSVAHGGIWQLEAKALFGGMGSFGNGSAMRVAPVGAYFAEDGYSVVARQALLSSEVTHRHPEGIAGGIAIAVAAAFAWQNRGKPVSLELVSELFDTILSHTPPGEVRDGIERASELGPELPARTAAIYLGNGIRVSCQDTVPFCLWVAARHLDDYRSAIWNAITACGDIDTMAAIVGGVVALSVGKAGLPAEWLARREELKFET
jgi:ADP-ribosylglycohydrolase